ncbi:histidine phosphatase family protein [Metasolibacillus meyeri]|uniref:Histidine phosphatase family protein n=1 Tax=Metasolibacillus meyeri TaxID=1071052 RepID=A0AAW9NXR2_9BACL|nr:histidine phosphatase family protein [Metasolibacillus meyeri]MEC1179605.1 histidine phosphatase family protein [Metasolibacillus meyeri]
MRHGQSEADILEVHEGRADFPLTELGVEQATKLAHFITARYQVDAIMTSPLQRAYQTANILKGNCKCDFIVNDDLMEYNNGVLAGLSRKKALIKYPLHVAIEGGESQSQFRYRVEQALHTILHDYGHLECVAIVAHGGTLLHLLNTLLGKTVEEQCLFHTGDTGLHILELKNGRKVIHCLNSQTHLV